MRPTHAMRTRVVIITAQAVMDRSPRVLRQNPDSIHCFVSSLPMPVVECQPAGRIDMKPVQQSFDASSRFIHMIQLLRQQQLFENLHRRGERAGCLLDPVGQRSHRENELPSRSSNTSPTRSIGSNWYCDRYTANDRTLGPYWAGA